jgi:hypothetical protein
MLFGIFILYQRAVQFSVTVPGAALGYIQGIFTARGENPSQEENRG